MIKLLQEKLSPFNVKIQTDVVISKYTTLGVGGKAAFLVEIQDSENLEKILKTANHYKIPYKLLGKGSNVIFSDDGFAGLVIVNRSKKWRLLDNPQKPCRFPSIKSRFQQLAGNETVEDIFSYDEQEASDALVRVDSGMQINSLMNDLYSEGITGLQWYSGIPATVGGAIYMNIHGADHYFSEIVHNVLLLTQANETKQVNNEYFKFAYDWSALHQTKEIILWADLCLKRGNVSKARKTGKEWARRKSFQPRRSAGCIFQNLSPELQHKFNLPTASAGYIIDHELGLKGVRSGDAVISQKHAAFIENLGNAKANDVACLIKLIRDKAFIELGIELQLEVELIGKFEALNE